MNLLFDIILGSELFRIKLGIPWLVAMNAVLLVVHKCLKFSHEDSIHVIHDTGYRPQVDYGNYSLDYFWIAHVGSLAPRKDLLYRKYQNYKKWCLRLKVRYPPSPYVVLHRACLKANSDATKACRREDEKRS